MTYFLSKLLFPFVWVVWIQTLLVESMCPLQVMLTTYNYAHNLPCVPIFPMLFFPKLKILWKYNYLNIWHVNLTVLILLYRYWLGEEILSDDLSFECHPVCRKCIYDKISEEELECCPICNTDLGCVPLEKLRLDLPAYSSATISDFSIFYSLSICNFNMIVIYSIYSMNWGYIKSIWLAGYKYVPFHIWCLRYLLNDYWHWTCTT